MKQSHLLVGEIVRPQGIRGEVKLRHFTDDPYRFEDLKTVLRKTGNSFEPLTVEACRVQGDDVYLKLKGFDDRNAAETLREPCSTWIGSTRRSWRKTSSSSPTCWARKPWTPRAARIGVLKDVLTPGGTDIFVFDTPAGEVMVPIIEKVVVSLDVEAGRIVLNEETLNEVAVYEDRHSDHLS